MSTGYFADACALVAFFTKGGALMGASGRQAMRGEVYVSPVTVWELARKAGLGLLPSLPTLNGRFQAWLANEGFLPENLIWEDSERANLLPAFHKDPMDRMLIAQSLRTGRPVITSDALFEAYGVTTIW